MKKHFLILMSILLAISLLGCTEKKVESETINNDVFTDAYFEGAKNVSLMGVAAPVAGEKMEQVIHLLQEVSLSELQEGVKVEGEGSSFLLVISFVDGTYKTVQLSNKTVAPTALDSVKYMVENEEFIEQILEVFDVPEEVF